METKHKINVKKYVKVKKYDHTPIINKNFKPYNDGVIKSNKQKVGKKKRKSRNTEVSTAKKSTKRKS